MKKPEIFPQTKRKNITFDFDTYNFSSIGRELTEDELYIINGGAQIENSNEAVANAQVGDTLTRKDGTVITINQGDIDYAKKQIAGSTNSNGSPVSSNTGAASGNDTETSHVNTETDVLSLVSYESGINSYDMKLLFDSKVVNVEETVTNIIDSINSPIYYFLIDHLTNLPYCENCNTALYNTVDINANGKF